VQLPKAEQSKAQQINKDGTIYTSRRKEFKNPNGTTEVVLQYYLDLGNDEYQWIDGDLVAALV
jgi:hypothetical protein